jgi:hypothetical protein
LHDLAVGYGRWRDFPRYALAVLFATGFLPIFAAGIFWPGRSRRHLFLPAVLFLAFFCLRAPVALLLPGLAWLTADGGLARLPVKPVWIVKASAYLALTGVCLIQYLPVRTHAHLPPPEAQALHRLAQGEGLRRAVLDPGGEMAPAYAWYGDVDVESADPKREPVMAAHGTVYVLRGMPPSAERLRVLQKKGWCPRQVLFSAVLLTACR